MYCPKCGQQQAFEEVLYCSRCGFNLNLVRTSLAVEHNTALTDTAPPHRDINSGLGIMLLGTLLTSGFVVIADVGPAGAFLILTLFFISVILSSRHLTGALHRLFGREEPLSGETTAGQKGMAFGALLMYLGTVLTTCAATMAPGRVWVPTFFFTLLTVFVLLLLFSRSLMRVVQELVSQEESQPAGFPRSRVSPDLLSGISSSNGVAALTSGRGLPATSLGAQRIRTAELAAPPSITERTTSLIAGQEAHDD